MTRTITQRELRHDSGRDDVATQLLPREAAIAALTLTNDLPLFTRNPSDLERLKGIGLQVRPV